MGRPYGQHYLTEEQKQLAADNINLVWWYIKTLLNRGKIRPPEIDDVAGHLIWFLCMAAEKYDPSRGVKFSTYAKFAFRTGFSIYIDLRSRWEDRFKIMGFEFAGESEEEYGYHYRPIREKYKPFVEWGDLEFLFDRIELSPLEEQIKYYYYEQRMEMVEIADVLDYSRERIRQIINNMAGRIKNYVDENGYVVEDFVSR
ncbi:MAG: sigma factor-like helix-turn-helix DNA-binding protein [Candidatus Asgardarchaeia archaeon]